MTEKNYTETILYCNKWTIKKPLAFVSQRDNGTKTFDAGKIEVQVEGIAQDKNHVVLRGKYPNDDYFVSTLVTNLEEITS